MKKVIKGYNGIYYIDEEGNVYRKNKKMKTYDNGTGYMQVKLRKGKERYNRYVHRLVWEAFKFPIPKGYEINHIDHNKKNNFLSNLELVTHSENLHKAFLKYGYFGSMKRPKNMLTLSQAKGILLEGAETTGGVKSP